MYLTMLMCLHHMEVILASENFFKGKVAVFAMVFIWCVADGKPFIFLSLYQTQLCNVHSLLLSVVGLGSTLNWKKIISKLWDGRSKFQRCVFHVNFTIKGALAEHKWEIVTSINDDTFWSLSGSICCFICMLQIWSFTEFLVIQNEACTVIVPWWTQTS